jgi:hypothetical protein
MKLQKYLTGASLIAGGAIIIYALSLHPKEYTDLESMQAASAVSARAHLLLYFGAVTLLMGLPGLYAFLSRSTGVLAMLSVPLLFLGLATSLVTHCPLEFAALPAILSAAPEKAVAIVEATSATPLAALEPIGWLMTVLGLILFLAGTWRQKEIAKYPRYLLLACLACVALAFAKVPYAMHGFTFGVFATFIAYGIEVLRSRPGEDSTAAAALEATHQPNAVAA